MISGYVDTGDTSQRLRGLATQLLDLRPFWPTAAAMGRRWFMEQFATEGGFFGTPWPDGPDYHGLVMSGQLKGAASSPARFATAQTLELIVSDRTIQWHQYGTRKMPARPILGPTVPGSALAELQAAFEGYVDAIVARWGF